VVIVINAYAQIGFFWMLVGVESFGDTENGITRRHFNGGE
ncbi:MAG: hypothetical protein RIQ85_693, partial [Pseudomonadota bacterium]